MSRYDDIINLPHPISGKHPRMALSDRAAQFAPFAALTGHEVAINETVRLTDERISLSEDVIDEINKRLNIIAKNIDDPKDVSIIYFVPDERKNGGIYEKHEGLIKKIDEYKKVIIMADDTKIPIEQIVDIRGDIFEEI